VKRDFDAGLQTPHKENHDPIVTFHAKPTRAFPAFKTVVATPRRVIRQEAKKKDRLAREPVFKMG
jgi:hypothetical protein